MVHSEQPLGSEEKQFSQARLNCNASCTVGATENKRAIIERYFIHDGKIDRLPDAQYEDADEDIQALKQDAGDLAPSARLGLVVQSRGGGGAGITTNIGPFLLIKQLMSSRLA
jgi:hypothetical protein